MDTCSIILAAGAGRRYRAAAGQDKLLVPAFTEDPESPSVLRMTAEAYTGVAERCLLVVSAENLERAAFATRLCRELGIELILVETLGLGHSLAQAIAHASVRNGWIIGLADMPYVRRDTVRHMATLISPKTLAVPLYAGRRGHPRVIGSSFETQLLQLEGDAGAQLLFGGDCLEIGVDDPGTVVDIDIPDHRLSVRS